MRVFITGAGGFIGSHLTADQLKRGRKVTAVDLNLNALEPLRTEPNLTLIQADFADRSYLQSFLEEHDVCFHLASAHLETNVDDRFFWEVNVDDTLRFLEQCHEAGVGRFVHCSSVGVFGEIDRLPANEETECKPDIAYEKSKLAGEQAVMKYARETGYEVVTVRPAWVYGPGCPRTKKLFRSIAKGRFFFVGDGQTLRHPIYVSDTVRGLEVVATHGDAVGEVFIIAGPRAVTLQELVTSISAIIGAQSPRVHLPKPAVYLGCYAIEVASRLGGRDAPFSRRSMQFFTHSSAFSTTKAQERLGFAATTELCVGLQGTNRWLRGVN